VLLLAAGLDLALLLLTRGASFGAVAGLEPRYFTDLAPFVPLAIALVFLDLPGAPGSSAPRSTPLITVDLGRRTVVLATGLVCVLGLVSQVVYARHWHAHNASAPYMQQLQRQVALHPGVAVADQDVPQDVLAPALLAPYNRLSVLAPLLGGDLAFPRATDALTVVDDVGQLHRADLDAVLETQPGPRTGCGWLVRDRARALPLVGRAIDLQWWLRIGYLASAATPVTVTAGDDSVETDLNPGLGELWVRVDATFDEITLSGLAPGTSACVDSIEVGQAVPGGLL
jgi:hypothetical protein